MERHLPDGVGCRRIDEVACGSGAAVRGRGRCVSRLRRGSDRHRRLVVAARHLVPVAGRQRNIVINEMAEALAGNRLTAGRRADIAMITLQVETAYAGDSRRL